MSLLPIVLAADNFPPHTGAYPTTSPDGTETYIPFHVCAADAHVPPSTGITPVGLIRPAVLAALRAVDGYEFVKSAEGEVIAVAFAQSVLDAGREGMDATIARTATGWRERGMFMEALDGWRNELYAIYASPRSAFLQAQAKARAARAAAAVHAGTHPDSDSASASAPTTFTNLTFACERAACALFGFATFGVHMTAYEGTGPTMQIWVPRRSPTKATWPSMLDNTVAGGIPAGLSPLETMVKECDEEASLPESLVRARLRNVGAATYFYITKAGYLQPEFEYLYDLELPPRSSAEYVLPHPHDDEVESFHVIAALHRGEFKPNCGLILVNFLVRHSLVTPENEPNYLEIMWRMYRPLGVGHPV